MFRWILLLATSFMVLASLSPALGYPVTVRAQGQGVDRESATQNALAEALRQINGLSMKASQKNSVQAARSTKTVNDSESITSTLKRTTSTNAHITTAGVISSYSIEDDWQENGLTYVVIKATAERYETPGHSPDNRRKLAVLPFWFQGNPSTTQTVTQAVVTRLVQARRFSVLDRENQWAYDQEKAQWTSSDSRIREKAKLAHRLGADYLVIGDLVRFDARHEVKTLELTGERLESDTGNARLSYRVLVPATRQVKWSADIDVSLPEDGSTGQAPTLRLADLLADELARDLLEAIYPIKVLKAEASGRVVINQGGASVHLGDKYTVFAPGKLLRDPYTKESLGYEERKVAVIELTDVKPKYSVARVVESLGAIPKHSICRRVGHTTGKEEPQRKASLVRSSGAAGGVRLPFD